MSGRPTLFVAGLGLMGGSLAASLRARGARWRVRAWDRRRGGLSYALDRGFVDEVADGLADGVRGARVVVLAVPVRGIRALLTELAALVEPGQVITDVGSTKVSILQAARELLPPEVAFVGGHPIAGTEASGVEGARPGLFEGRRCVLTPEAQTPRDALERVTDLWTGVGAEVTYMDAAEHDRTFARLSHLPHVVAYSLVNAVGATASGRDADLAGGAFRDFTRVARSSPATWRDVCLENRTFVLDALDAFSERLAEVRRAIDGADAGTLEAFFQQAASTRNEPWPP